MRARPLRPLIATAALLSVAGLPADALARARPDPSFGQGRGWVTTGLRGLNVSAGAALVTRGGKVVAAGQAISQKGFGQALVARYRSNGRLDPGFGRRGLFRTSLPAKRGPFVATAMTVQRGTGQIVVAGGYGPGSILVFRLTASGRLDRSFGRRGYTTTAVGGIANAISTDPRGRVLVGASDSNLNGRPMVVARYSRSGRLDRSFGTRGLTRLLFWDANLAASAGVVGLSATTDGGVVGFGHLDYIGGDGHGSAGVFRLDPSGRLLPGFGTGGHTEIAFKPPGGVFAQWFPAAMTRDSKGRLTITGGGSLGAGSRLQTVRLDSRGTPDPSFGAQGLATADGLVDAAEFPICGAALTRRGTFTAGVGPTLVQLRANGSPNTRFGPGGILRIARPRQTEVNAVVAGRAGRIVVAGLSGSKLYVARFRP